jgi:type 1 glutamine amidotransferase
VLIFTRATGFVHESIRPAAMAIKGALAPLGVTAEIGEDPAVFTAAALARYGSVILVSTTGMPLGDPGTTQIDALATFVRGGRGLAGVHAASNGHSESAQFVGLVGGDFIDHPGGVRRGSCAGQGTFPSVTRLPNPFVITDEFYVFAKYRMDNEVDLTCESATGGARLPIAWHRTEGAGRVFYTGLGHGTEEWSDRRLLDDHVVPGILWTLRR